MKSKFWASVVAIITTAIIVALNWIIQGELNESVAFCIATVALYFALRDDLLREDD